MKRINRVLMIMVLSFIIPINVKAATTYISANDTVVNGNEVKATVTLKDVAAWDIRISGDGSTNGCSTHEVGDSGNGNNTTKYFSVTCRANSLGTITFSYNGDVTSSDGKNTKVSGSKKVTVVKPREKSNNNNLKSLSVEGYTLTPEFSKDTLEYNVEVTDDKETIKINAEREDGYSSLEGDGEKEVAEGINKFEVKVTSETGKEKVYTLNINVKDANPIEKKINGDTYSLVKRSKTLVVPDGLDKEKFTSSTITIDETEIPALVSEELGLTFVGLKDKNDLIYLYKVEDGSITTRYELLTTKGLSVEFKEPKEVLDGYTKTTIKIGDKEYTVYQNDYKNYALIYGTNIDTKEDNWYQYNIKEKSLQSYNKDLIDNMNKDFDKEINTYKMLSFIGIGISIVLLFIVIILIIKLSKKKNKKDKFDIFDEEEKDNTKELDKAEIIINKVELKKKEEKVEKKSKKKETTNKKKEDKKQSQFLNTQDLKEILEEPKKEEVKEVKKRKSKVIEDEEMALDFLDEKRKKRRK